MRATKKTKDHKCTNLTGILLQGNFSWNVASANSNNRPQSSSNQPLLQISPSLDPTSVWTKAAKPTNQTASKRIQHQTHQWSYLRSKWATSRCWLSNRTSLAAFQTTTQQIWAKAETQSAKSTTTTIKKTDFRWTSKIHWWETATSLISRKCETPKVSTFIYT